MSELLKWQMVRVHPVCGGMQNQTTPQEGEVCTRAVGLQEGPFLPLGWHFCPCPTTPCQVCTGIQLALLVHGSSRVPRARVAASMEPP